MRAQKGHPEVQKGHTKGTGRKERKESPRGAMQFAKGVPLVPFVPLSLLKPIESPSKQGLFPSHRYPITTLSLPIIQTFRSDSTDIRQRYDREQATIHRRMSGRQAEMSKRDKRDKGTGGTPKTNCKSLPLEPYAYSTPYGRNQDEGKRKRMQPFGHRKSILFGWNFGNTIYFCNFAS